MKQSQGSPYNGWRSFNGASFLIQHLIHLLESSNRYCVKITIMETEFVLLPRWLENVMKEGWRCWLRVARKDGSLCRIPSLFSHNKPFKLLVKLDSRLNWICPVVYSSLCLVILFSNVTILHMVIVWFYEFVVGINIYNSSLSIKRQVGTKSKPLKSKS